MAMKKTIITLLLLLINSLLFGQSLGPADGTIAPDFTVADVYGNVHTLSEYLNNNKTVIIEMGGLYCQPCWEYHATKQLADFYNAYGPSGSNEVEVLWVETASFFDIDDLQSPLAPQSLGNWLEGTPYPMILSTEVYNLYTTNYVPSFFRICPNGILTEISQSSPAGLKSYVNSCNTLSGVQNHGAVSKPDIKNGFCGTSGEFNIQFKNYGTNPITNANFKLIENGVVAATKQYSGSLPQFGSVTLAFPQITINPSAIYTVILENINGTNNFNPEFSVAELPFTISKVTTNDIKIKVHTFSCPGYMSWNISDSQNNVVANGGPYEGSSSTSPCLGNNADTIIEHNIMLSGIDECYTLQMLSSAGFGWKNYTGIQDMSVTPGIELFAGQELIYSYLNVGNFGEELIIENFITTDNFLNTEDVISEVGFVFYPNPSTGIISIDSNSIRNILIYDLTGKEVFTIENTANISSVNLSHLEDGIYMVKCKDINNHVISKKLVISR